MDDCLLAVDETKEIGEKILGGIFEGNSSGEKKRGGRKSDEKRGKC